MGSIQIYYTIDQLMSCSKVKLLKKIYSPEVPVAGLIAPSFASDIFIRFDDLRR